MNDKAQSEQIVRLETSIAKLTAAIELGRAVNLVMQAVLAAMGVVIIAIGVSKAGFDPLMIAGVVAALAIGSIFLAWSRHRQGLLLSVLKIAELHKAEVAAIINADEERREKP